MINNNQHIISKFNWETKMNDRSLAFELQKRISSWSKEPLNRELKRVFNKLCPEDQVWKVDQLEIDLGVINLENLERDLSSRLDSELTEKLIQLTLRTFYSDSRIEIIDRQKSDLEIVDFYLQRGYYSWSYQTDLGSLDEMILRLLTADRSNFINHLRKIGKLEKVRKRLAWQTNEKTIQNVIRELEPNSSDIIIALPEELEKLRRTKSFFHAEKFEFRKNTWFWILNYLLTERGTLFNKISFTKSILKQSASHYNIDYQDLLNLLQQALMHIEQRIIIRSEFITVIHALSSEKEVTHESETDVSEEYWAKFSAYLRGKIKKKDIKVDLNELIQYLNNLNKNRLNKILRKCLTQENLKKNIDGLDVDSLKSIFSNYALSSVSWRIKEFQSLFLQLKEREQSLNEKRFWTAALFGVVKLSNNSLGTKQWIIDWVDEFSLETSVKRQDLVYSMDRIARKTMNLESSKQIRTLQLSELGKKFNLNNNIRLSELIESIAEAILSDDFKKQELENLGTFLIRSLEIDPKRNFRKLIEHPNKELLLLVLNRFVSDDLINRLIIFGDINNQTVLAIQKEITEGLFVQHAGSFSLHFVNTIVTELNRRYILNGGKISFDLIEHLIISKINLIGKHDRIQFVKEISKILSSLESVIPIHIEKKIEFERIINSSDLLSFSDRWEFCLKNKFISDSFIVELVKNSINDLTQKGLLNRNDEFVKKIVTRVFKSLSWKEFNEIIKTWSSFEIDLDLQKMSRNYKVETLLSILLDLGPLAKKSEIALRLCQFLHNTHHLDSLKKEQIQLKLEIKPFNECQKDNELVESLVASLKRGKWKLKFGGDSKSTESYLDELLKSKPAKFLEVISLIQDSNILRELIKRIGLIEVLFYLSTLTKFRSVFRSCIEWYELSSSLVPERNKPEEEVRLIELSIPCILSKSVKDHFLEDFIQLGLNAIITNTSMNCALLVQEINDKRFNLSSKLVQALLSKEKAFALLESNSLEGNESLEQEVPFSDENITLICQHILEYGALPLWFEKNQSFSAVNGIQQFLERFGSSLLFEIKQMKSSDLIQSKISQAVSFSNLLEIIVRIKPSRSHFFDQLNRLHVILKQLSISSFLLSKINNKMYQDLLGSLKTDDWEVFNPERFWKDLIWKMIAVSGLKETELLEIFTESRLKISPAFRISLDRLLRANVKQQLISDNVIENVLEDLNEAVWEEPELEKEGLHVKNAGLVLLNNYVQMLFERSGLIDDNGFKNIICQHSAVYYLQFACIMNIGSDEGVLALNKVMSGIHPSEVILPLEKISEEHIELIEGMLTAMASYWTEIGETSPIGFRGNWLVRDGVLVEQEDRWELTVEKRPYDILLNQAPFSFSIIRYPWMKKPLHVNWTY
ncbi:MAG: contractile injection system tape measure protein [Crocinitomicaceae bacterium]